MTLRVSTFNCENLLSRASLLNYDDNSVARKPLSELATLQGVLDKPAYTEEDKRDILDLLDTLKDFVELNELRGKLISKKNGATRVKPSGRGEWVGGIRLKEEKLPLETQKNTALVIKAVGADIQCVVEVENRPTLEQFSQEASLKALFPYNMVLDGNDDRGIDVGILSKYELGRIKTHIFDMNGAPKMKRIFSRDCLEAEVILPGGKSVFLLVNHFKSQGYGSKQSNDARRKLQAERVTDLLTEYDLSKDLVIVAGDFNDKPGNPPLASLLNHPGLTDVLGKQFPNAADRWTYKDKSQIDYLLVSKPLARVMTSAGIERRGMFNLNKLTKGAEDPFPTVTSDTNDASDHAAVWAEFST